MIYRVIVDISNSEIDRVFDYSSSFEVETGSRVSVPFGNRVIEGFVVGTKPTTDIKTKDILKKLDEFTPIIPEMLALTEHLKKNNNLRYVDCLRLCIPSKLRGGKVKDLVRNYVKLDVDREIAKTLIRRNSPKQLALIENISTEGEYETVLNGTYGQSTVKALLEKGILFKEQVRVNRKPKDKLNADVKKVELNDEQKNAVETIKNSQKPSVLPLPVIPCNKYALSLFASIVLMTFVCNGVRVIVFLSLSLISYGFLLRFSWVTLKTPSSINFFTALNPNILFNIDLFCVW